MNFSRYVNQDVLKKTEENLAYESIAELLMKTIDSICKSYDEYQWVTPIINEQKGLVILRMTDSEIIENKSYYYLISGIIEFEMNKYLTGTAVNVNILQINEEEKIVDLEFEF